MILRVAQAVFESHVDERILVYRKSGINQLVGHLLTKAVYNPKASRGQSEAVKLGLHHVSPTSACCLFFMGDQPFINAATINEIIDLWKGNPEKIVVPLYDGTQGNPVLFPRRYYPSLMKIKGDHGGREVIKNHQDAVVFVEISEKKAGVDADTHAAYIRLVSDQHDNNQDDKE